jgi:hypothetical protein
MSPLPGVMGAGRLLDDDDALPPGAADDDDGLDGDISVWISASVQCLMRSSLDLLLVSCCSKRAEDAAKVVVSC